MLPYEMKLKQASRELRNNTTDVEKILWDKLRKKQLGLPFYRQKPVGEYIVDFYCPKAKLVIELDGEYHTHEEIKKYDRVRDEYVKNLGLTIIRFTNDEVLKNVGRVVDRIVTQIPLSPPLRKGETESHENKM